MVKKYVRFGEEGRWAQYTFDEVSARLHRVRLVTSLCEIFSKELQNPVLRVRTPCVLYRQDLALTSCYLRACSGAKST